MARTMGSQSYSEDDKKLFIKLMLAIVPLNAEEWRLVAEKYNQAQRDMPESGFEREFQSLKYLWKNLKKMKKTSDNAATSQLLMDIKKVDSLITEKARLIELGEPVPAYVEEPSDREAINNANETETNNEAAATPNISTNTTAPANTVSTNTTSITTTATATATTTGSSNNTSTAPASTIPTVVPVVTSAPGVPIAPAPSARRSNHNEQYIPESSRGGGGAPRNTFQSHNDSLSGSSYAPPTANSPKRMRSSFMGISEPFEEFNEKFGRFADVIMSNIEARNESAAMASYAENVRNEERFARIEHGLYSLHREVRGIHFYLEQILARLTPQPPPPQQVPPQAPYPQASIPQEPLPQPPQAQGPPPQPSQSQAPLPQPPQTQAPLPQPPTTIVIEEDSEDGPPESKRSRTE